MRKILLLLAVAVLAGCRLWDSSYDGSMALVVRPDGETEFVAEPFLAASESETFEEVGRRISNGGHVRVSGYSSVEVDLGAIHNIVAEEAWRPLVICVDDRHGEFTGAGRSVANDACLIVDGNDPGQARLGVATIVFQERQVWPRATTPVLTGVVVPLAALVFGAVSLAPVWPHRLRVGRQAVALGIVSGAGTLAWLGAFASTVPDMPRSTPVTLTTARMHEVAADAAVAVLVILVVIAVTQAWVARGRRLMLPQEAQRWHREARRP